MAENSKIEWTDHTFNPWLGCTKVSPACTNCYAEGWAKRSGLVQWGNGAERRVTSDKNWREPLKWDKKAAAEGKRLRVFCSSLADVFEDHPSISIRWRRGLGDLIINTPNLDWLLLTKRPDNAVHFMRQMFRGCVVEGKTIPQPNVWIGTTVENQEYANKRIPELLKIPAKVRFLSIEPMLGQIDLSCVNFGNTDVHDVLFPQHGPRYPGNGQPLPRLPGNSIDWVIAGGESGPHARPTHPDWFRSLQEQCQAAGVPFHFKQHGEWLHASQIGADLGDGMNALGIGKKIHRWPDGTFSAWVGKKNAGRELDGRTWDEMPEVRI